MAAKVAKTIDGHLYDPRLTEYYANLRTRRLHARTSLRYRLSRLNNPSSMMGLSGYRGKFNPNLKLFAVAFFCLAILLGGFALSGGPLFHSLQQQPASHIDPSTVLWSASGSANDISEYNSILASYTNTVFDGCTAPCKGLKLSPNSTETAVALSKNPIGALGVANGKEFDAFLAWYVSSGACCGNNQPWGFFLTTNSTLPTLPGYNPRDDKNIALLGEIKATGGGMYSTVLFVQRNIGSTVNQEDTGGCSNASNCYLAASVAINPAIHVESFQSELNYTGASASNGGAGGSACNAFGFGDGCSYVRTVEDPGVIAGTGASQTFPFFPLTAANYYFGIYAVSNLGFAPAFLFNGFAPSSGGSMQLASVIPTVTGVITVLPTVDTGGFFGPIVKALIGIGAHILAGIFNFGQFLSRTLAPFGNGIVTEIIGGLSTIVATVFGVVQAILNAIGSAIGIPNLGNSLFTLLGALSSWFTTFFGDALTNLSSIITALVNGFNAFTGIIGTYWTDLTNWFTATADWLAGFWTIGSVLVTFGSAGVGALFSLWMLYGAVKFAEDFNEGMNWYHSTSYGILLGYSLTYYLVIQLVNYVVIPIAHVVTSFNTSVQASKWEIAGTDV